MPADRISAVIRSGWTPAALLAILITTLQVGSGTSARDLLAFTAYAVLALVVPGTLLWRLLRPDRQRLWLEDVVFGAILGYAVEIPAYLVARAIGLPLLVIVWPVAIYILCLVTKRGRRVWRARQTSCAPTSWSWLIAGVSTYLVLFVARASWWGSVRAADRHRVIGPDASFQLALTGELRHHASPVVPWVAGEPLHYHWLTYVHTASATWLTGIEPVVMLGRLAPLLMMLIIVLATALVAARWSQRLSVGALAAGLLVLVHSPAFSSAEADHFQRQEFTSQSIFGSPTMTFGLVLFCGALFFVVEVLGGQQTRSTWPLLILLLGGASGAKATFPPMMVAGALTAVVLGLLARSPIRREMALLGVTAASWLTFQFGFYGGEDIGLKLTSSGTIGFASRLIGAATPEAVSAAGLAMSATIVLLWTAHMAGMAGLTVLGGWRESMTPFAVGFTASGVAASLLLDLGSFSQQWFVCSTQVMVAVGAACGFARLVPRGSLRELLPTAGIAALLGAVAMSVGWALSDPHVPPIGPPLPRLLEYAGPFIVAVLVLVLLAVVYARLPSPVAGTFVGVLFLCAGLTGLGLFRTTQVTIAMLQVPWPRSALPVPDDTTVGRGGVEAARWLRDRSQADEVLATNGHMLTPNSKLPLALWLAGYAERRVLVEGWGYTAKHSEMMADNDLNFEDVPFWDETRLRDNDAAFTEPTEEAVNRLREEYDVTWLVLDRRFAADPGALNNVLPQAFARGDYVVYRIG